MFSIQSIPKKYLCKAMYLFIYIILIHAYRTHNFCNVPPIELQEKYIWPLPISSKPGCERHFKLHIFFPKISDWFIDTFPTRPPWESVKRLRNIISVRSRLDTLLSAEVQIINHGRLALYYCVFFHPRSGITV